MLIVVLRACWVLCAGWVREEGRDMRERGGERRKTHTLKNKCFF